MPPAVGESGKKGKGGREADASAFRAERVTDKLRTSAFPHDASVSIIYPHRREYDRVIFDISRNFRDQRSRGSSVDG